MWLRRTRGSNKRDTFHLYFRCGNSKIERKNREVQYFFRSFENGRARLLQRHDIYVCNEWASKAQKAYVLVSNEYMYDIRRRQKFFRRNSKVSAPYASRVCKRHNSSRLRRSLPKQLSWRRRTDSVRSVMSRSTRNTPSGVDAKNDHYACSKSMLIYGEKRTKLSDVSTILTSLTRIKTRYNKGILFFP